MVGIDGFVFNDCPAGTVEEQFLRVLHDKINMFEQVVGERDGVWIEGQESGQVEQGFEELARRLIEAKKAHLKTQELDESLFAQDFEV